MLATIVALAKSTHPLPSVAVSAIVVILGFGVGLEPWRLAVLGLAILCNQFSIGLSNDAIDAERDRAVGRTDKPVALGLVSVRLAWGVAVSCAAAAIVLTIPLGPAAVAAHAVFLASGWVYNVGLKSTAFSVVPYVIGFGAVPLIVTLSLPEPALASPWAILAAALLGVSAHFANVLPDLDDDEATGVYGLPHRVGRRASGLVIAGALAGASVCIVLGIGGATTFHVVGLLASLILATWCAVLVLTNTGSKLVFRLIMIGALIDVVLLAVSGERIIA